MLWFSCKDEILKTSFAGGQLSHGCRRKGVTMSEKNGYVHPEVLVDTDWVEAHLNDPTVRIIEVDVDTAAYANEGHIPGAAGFNWQKDLQDQLIRAPLLGTYLEELLGRTGVSNDTTIVLYGDNNNWFAAWAFWILTFYGHKDVRLLDGGRVKWLLEEREINTQVPSYPQTTYHARVTNTEIRALRDYILSQLGQGYISLVDVRSPGEYSGELLAPANLPQEGAQRGGHIPGAANIPWSMAVREDGTFKSADELRSIYENKGITSDKEVIAYCRIGERSSHSWFVLHYLLGYPKVRNYDGSWTEWGSLIGAPIER
jgi:thiosulfate/3-mercaptopyruvate sulfurtransferase